MHEGVPGLSQQRIREYLRDEREYEVSGRATVEGSGDLLTLLADLRRVLDIVEEAPGGGTLDHLWVYLDTPDYGGEIQFDG